MHPASGSPAGRIGGVYWVTSTRVKHQRRGKGAEKPLTFGPGPRAPGQTWETTGPD